MRILLSARTVAKWITRSSLAPVPKPTSFTYSGLTRTNSRSEAGASASAMGKVGGEMPLEPLPPSLVHSHCSHAVTKHCTLAVSLAPSAEYLPRAANGSCGI